MSGRGHRAVLPACGHARPEYLVADADGGLTVRHYNREGRAREYYFTQLPVPAPMQASLAVLFAARCTPDRWSMHITSASAWLCIRRFAGFLAGLEPVPRDLDELTAGMVRQWRVSLPAEPAAIGSSRRSAACCATTTGSGPGRWLMNWPAAPRHRGAGLSLTARQSSNAVTAAARGDSAPPSSASTTTPGIFSSGGTARSPRAPGSG